MPSPGRAREVHVGRAGADLPHRALRAGALSAEHRHGRPCVRAVGRTCSCTTRRRNRSAILDEMEWVRENAKIVAGARCGRGRLDRAGRRRRRHPAGPVAGGHALLRRNLRPAHDGGRGRSLAETVLAAYRWQCIVSGVQDPRFRQALGSMITDRQAARITRRWRRSWRGRDDTCTCRNVAQSDPAPVIALHCSGRRRTMAPTRRALPRATSPLRPSTTAATARVRGAVSMRSPSRTRRPGQSRSSIARWPSALVGHFLWRRRRAARGRRAAGPHCQPHLYEPTAFHLLRAIGARALAPLRKSGARRQDRRRGDHRQLPWGGGFVCRLRSGPAHGRTAPVRAGGADTRWMPKAPLDFRALIDEPTTMTAYTELRIHADPAEVNSAATNAPDREGRCRPCPPPASRSLPAPPHGPADARVRGQRGDRGISIGREHAPASSISQSRPCADSRSNPLPTHRARED